MAALHQPMGPSIIMRGGIADQLDLQALHRVRERLVSPVSGHNENRVIGGEVDVAATPDRPEHPPVLAC